MMASKGASREAEGKVSEREEGDAEIHQERTAHDTKPCNWKFVFMHVYTSSHRELEADVWGKKNTYEHKVRERISL